MAASTPPGNWSMTARPTPMTAVAPILTSTCASPLFTILPGSDPGTVTLAPVIGCFNARTECCPYTVSSAASTAISELVPPARTSGGQSFRACPADYYSTASGCCPLKWPLWPKPVGGASCCYTSTSNLGAGADVSLPTDIPESISVVRYTDIAFAYQYPLAPASPTGLSTGAKAGIGAGAGCAALIILALLVALIMSRRKARREREQNTSAAAPTVPTSVGSISQPPLPPPPPFQHPPKYDDPAPHPPVQQVQQYHDPRGGYQRQGITPVRMGARSTSPFDDPYRPASELADEQYPYELPPGPGQTPVRERW